MSTDKKSSPLLKVRTFAHDLQTTRAATNHQAPAKPKPVVAPTIVEKDIPEQKPVVTVIEKEKPKPASVRTMHHDAPAQRIKAEPEVKKPVPKIPPPPPAPKKVPSPVPTSSAPKNTAPVPTKIAPLPKKEVRDTTYEATIITDAKHNRFNLSSEILVSISRWWKNLQKNRDAKNKPKYTVPRAERRKGVIQRATSSTARATTADHSAVLKRIKETKDEDRVANKISETPNQNAVPTIPPPTLPPLPVTPIATTPVTLEPVLPEIPAPVVGYDATPEIIIPVMPVVPEPTPEPEIEEEPLYEEEVVDDIEETDEYEEAEEDYIEAIPEPTPEPVLPPPTPVVVTPIVPGRIEPLVPAGISPLPAPTNTTPAVTTSTGDSQTIQKIRSRFRIPRFSIMQRLIDNPNQLALIALSLITLIFVGYIGVKSLIGTTTPTNPVADETILFTGATRYHDIFIATNKQTMFDQIGSYRDDTTSLFEVVFTGPDSTTRIPASTIFGILGTSLPADFIASIESIVFGYYRGEPFMVLRTGNKNTAYGGMLQWEPNLSRDLDPWFGAVVRTGGGTTNFTDGTIGTTDVRVLQGSDGRERITYGFVGQQSLIITTNTTAFLNLRSSLQE